MQFLRNVLVLAGVALASDRAYTSDQTVRLNWNKWIRQIHRWLSITFAVGVTLNLFTAGKGKYTAWVGLSTWLLLFSLLFTGLYLFVLPYAAKWRSKRRRRVRGSALA